MKFRHQPVKIVEGLLKLGHVAIEVKEALIPPPREERLKRLLPIDRKLLERDAEAFNAFRDESVCLDWAWPHSIIYDIFLMDELAPWDYGELTALKPAYLEGKVQLLASENLGDWQAKIPDWILQRTAPQRLRRAFGLEKIQLRWVSRDIRNHSYGLVLLPIYAMEISLEDGGFLRLMMNGQTGKAALQITTIKEEFTRIIEPSTKLSLPPESTILSPPIPIRYVKSPFLHERLTLSEALVSR